MALIKTVQHQELRHQPSFCLDGAISIIASGVARVQHASPTHGDLERIRQYCGRIKALGEIATPEAMRMIAQEWEMQFPRTTPPNPMRSLMTPAFKHLLRTVGQALYQAKQAKKEGGRMSLTTNLNLQAAFKF
jgi:hypothetical protein